MLAVFFDRVKPASTDAKPICIMKIRIAASSTQMVSAAEESPSMRAVMSIVFSIT